MGSKWALIKYPKQQARATLSKHTHTGTPKHKGTAEVKTHTSLPVLLDREADTQNPNYRQINSHKAKLNLTLLGPGRNSTILTATEVH